MDVAEISVTDHTHADCCDALILVAVTHTLIVATCTLIAVTHYTPTHPHTHTRPLTAAIHTHLHLGCLAACCFYQRLKAPTQPLLKLQNCSKATSFISLLLLSASAVSSPLTYPRVPPTNLHTGTYIPTYLPILLNHDHEKCFGSDIRSALQVLFTEARGGGWGRHYEQLWMCCYHTLAVCPFEFWNCCTCNFLNHWIIVRGVLFSLLGAGLATHVWCLGLLWWDGMVGVMRYATWNHDHPPFCCAHCRVIGLR